MTSDNQLDSYDLSIIMIAIDMIVYNRTIMDILLCPCFIKNMSKKSKHDGIQVEEL